MALYVDRAFLNSIMDVAQTVPLDPMIRHLEILAVTLSAAKGLARRMQRSFASLRACPERSEGMTARTPLKSAHSRLANDEENVIKTFCNSTREMKKNSS